MAIRILHFVDSLGMGGLENGLANVIERLDPARFEHTVCAIRALGPIADRIPAGRVRVICMQKSSKEFPVQIGAIARQIRELRPDIVHSRNWGAVEAMVAGRWVRTCALVHSEHGIDVNDAQSEPARRSWFRRLSFELADRVFSVSYQLRDLHSRRTGFPARKIDVIHNGVDSERFAPHPAARARMRQELGVADDEFCIGAVGRMDPIKDYPTLLRAADLLAARHPRWRLLLAGDGPALEAVRTFADEMPNLRGRVQFLGATSRIPEFLNALDVYTLPSISEGISNSLLEAMATGLPVVVSATGGNPEVVVDGECGLLFPVGDAPQLANRLWEVASGADLRRQLAARALARMEERFSMQAMIRKYESLYGSLAQLRAA